MPGYGQRGRRSIWSEPSIDLGADGDVVTVVIYASGLRGQYDIRDVRVVVDGLSLAVEFADRYSRRTGLDTVSFILPRALAGRRTVDASSRLDVTSQTPVVS